ncbi:CLUMA_CG000144, isoform A [Clunio marinus]|uniref:CLUMA_CG000144, isoform A n=1 Tax=Clunio marinus TaxID=568069 RepID=A0A1J1HK02_9DIPT|nr:CLUMA_CG000144, isoform A [Clunio marinus]
MLPMMNQRLPHMPPHHSLGLLNSFIHHASPLDLMTAHHHDHPPTRTYNTQPSFVPADPTENECKIVEYRGQKVAAFIIQGETMLCLPQAFDLFLKNLVGGLHTVHSKLKRLDIVPLVCTVEQIRLLRGLGALQPGVNRCKLLASKHFDILYRDCTTARCLSVKPNESSRRGRPPKQGLSGLSSYEDFNDDDSIRLKKYRIDEKDSSHDDLNGKSKYITADYAPSAMHMQFMQMNQHRLAQSNAMMSTDMQAQHLHRAIEENNNKNSNIANLNRANLWETCSASYESFVKNLERLRKEKMEENEHENENQVTSGNMSPSNESPVLNLSKNKRDSSITPEFEINAVSPEPQNVDNSLDVDDASDMEVSESSLHSRSPQSPPNLNNKLNFHQRDFARPPPSIAFPSTEILLRNIQELLKVVLENSIQHEQQISFEKAELKMNALREREINSNLERRLSEEQKLRALYQKRYNRDRKFRFKLQRQIEEEYEKHQRLEEILKTSGTTDSLKCFSEFMGDNKVLNNTRQVGAGERSDCESEDKMSNSTISTDTKEKEMSSPKSN